MCFEGFPNLHVLLLGVNSFLGKFILDMDYPGKTFSISSPSKAAKKRISVIKL